MSRRAEISEADVVREYGYQAHNRLDEFAQRRVPPIGLYLTEVGQAYVDDDGRAWVMGADELWRPVNPTSDDEPVPDGQVSVQSPPDGPNDLDHLECV
jgi:hypothetical protein